ncbi:hypothetical protein [Coprobacter tertius]|uniref:Uncharacterized protein n=1 Tax=Coprobacter tertius TaxID=2944915 RepID=A0ABT1MCX8_9BACT|nr:hypothetical protein [Coprobacter tertius]MCP9610497.1 hypothetical protein [Coprobacter tertius]
MQKIHNACAVLQTMKDSNDKDLVLLYGEIKSWIAKLEAMSDVILKSLQFLKCKGEDNSSRKSYLILQDKYNTLHTDSAYFITQLEGSGTNTIKKIYEVHPSQINMESFIDYIVPLTKKYASSLHECQK